MPIERYKQEDTNWDLLATCIFDVRYNGIFKFFLGILELSYSGETAELCWLNFVLTWNFLHLTTIFPHFQVIFKCCKLIPVLIGSILIQGKRYSLLDFLAAGLMCLGLILFTLADSMISPRFDMVGVAMISCALLCDAVIGNIQEKAMKQHKATNTEVVLYSYSIGFLYLFIILTFTGDIVKGISFCGNVRYFFSPKYTKQSTFFILNILHLTCSTHWKLMAMLCCFRYLDTSAFRLFWLWCKFAAPLLQLQWRLAVRQWPL